MDKVIKINSRQGGPFNKSQNLVDFTIPDDGAYDMDKSFVNIHAKVSVDSSNDGGVYNYQVYYKTEAGIRSNNDTDNIALVRNVDFSTSRAGSLENIRRVDILRQNLKNMAESVDDKNGKLYKKLNQYTTRSGYVVGPGLELHGEGTVKSTYQDTFPIQIPMSDLLNLGRDVLPMDKLGQGRLHLELWTDKWGVEQVFKSGETMISAEYQAFADVSAVGDVSVLTTRHSFKRLEDSPYWVSQALQFSGTGAGGGPSPSNVKRIITGIEHLSNGTLELTLESPLATLTSGQSITAITCDGVNWVDATLTFEYAELVLQKSNESVPSGNLTYTTWTSEEDNGNGLTSFQKQYIVEPNAVNVLAFFPDGNTGLMSINTDLTKYRLRIDNADLTDRDVEDGSPLYYDRLSMTFANMGMRLKNLHEEVRDNRKNITDFDDAFGTFPLVSIATPCNATQNNKLLQFNIDATGNGIKKLVLFKNVIRQVKV